MQSPGYSSLSGRFESLRPTGFRVIELFQAGAIRDAVVGEHVGGKPTNLAGGVLSRAMLETQARSFALFCFGFGRIVTKSNSFGCGAAVGELTHFNQSLTKFSDAFDRNFSRRFGASAEKAQESAVCRPVRGSAVEDPSEFAGVMLQTIAHSEGGATVEGTGVVLHAAFEIFGVDSFRPAVANLVFQSPSAEIEPGAIEIKAAHVDSGHPNHHRCAIGELLKIFNV